MDGELEEKLSIPSEYQGILNGILQTNQGIGFKVAQDRELAALGAIKRYFGWQVDNEAIRKMRKDMPLFDKLCTNVYDRLDSNM